MKFDSNFQKAALMRFFGFSEFLPGQSEVINSILDLRDTLVVMPTGAGKSLCYQLPAAILEGTAIIISPLIALMQDQVDSLKNTNLRSASINSTQSYTEMTDTIREAIDGNFKLIYIAPERLENKLFIKELKKIRISFLAVDEAHCISEWGHDFRPSYLNIANVIDEIKNIPKIALTATATPEVQDDIIHSLKMKRPNRFISGFDRKNLSYITINTNQKEVILKKIIKKIKEPIIVYCGTRKRVEFYSDYLLKNEINAVAYHAGLDKELRFRNQNSFMNDGFEVIVATNAFGMGINKLNVRAVVHCDLTQTIESYYQEAGRAGRDGLPSDCILLYNKSDRKLQEFFIESNYPSKDDFLKVFNSLKKVFGGNIHLVSNQYLNIMDFANSINLPIIKVNTIMNIFEKNGLIKFSNDQTFSSIKLCMDASGIRRLFYSADLKQKIILESLLRNIPASSYEGYKRVDIAKISEMIGVTLQEYKEQLRIFEISGVISIKNLSSEGKMILNFDDETHIFDKINYEKLEVRKKRAYEKLDKVIEFAETRECKRNFILEYFSETNYKGVCGRCSSCNSQTLTKIYKQDIESSSFREHSGRKLEKPKEAIENEETTKKISALSKAIFDLISKGMNIKDVSKKMRVTEAEVAWGIQELIENDYFVLIEQFVDIKTYKKIKQIVTNFPYSPLRIIRENIDEVIEIPILRIATAFARKELGIDSNIFKKKK